MMQICRNVGHDRHIWNSTADGRQTAVNRKNWILAPRITTQLARPHPNVPVSGSRRTKKSPYHQIRQEPYLKEFLGT